jgi:acetyl-CoA carboxylase biotin carboxyl carrier protein
MDIRKVKKLIELLEESGISEIEITEGEDAVRISRYPPPSHSQPAPQIVTQVATPGPRRHDLHHRGDENDESDRS